MKQSTNTNIFDWIADRLGITQPKTSYVFAENENGSAGKVETAGEDAFLSGFNKYGGGLEQPEKIYITEDSVYDRLHGTGFEGLKNSKALDSVSNLLTAASLIPGADIITNALSIPVDLLRGDYLSAGLDAIGMIPVIGEVGDVGKYLKTVDKVADGVKVADDVVDSIKAVDKATDALRSADAAVDAAKVSDALKVAEDYYDVGKEIDLPKIRYPGDDPSIAPGKDYEWRGKYPPSEGLGAWYNPQTNESMHWDLNHADPIGPHWDYIDANGNNFRIYKDGSIELSKKGGKKK